MSPEGNMYSTSFVPYCPPVTSPVFTKYSHAANGKPPSQLEWERGTLDLLVTLNPQDACVDFKSWRTVLDLTASQVLQALMPLPSISIMSLLIAYQISQEWSYCGTSLLRSPSIIQQQNLGAGSTKCTPSDPARLPQERCQHWLGLHLCGLPCIWVAVSRQCTWTHGASLPPRLSGSTGILPQGPIMGPLLFFALCTTLLGKTIHRLVLSSICVNNSRLYLHSKCALCHWLERWGGWASKTGLMPTTLGPSHWG